MNAFTEWLDPYLWIVRTAIAVLALVGIWYWHHATYESGIAAEVAIVKAQAVKDEAALQEKADKAEHKHDQELSDLQHYRDTHIDQPVRLCLSTSVRAADSFKPNFEVASPAAPSVQPVSPGDPGLRQGAAGPDINSLLSAFGARADQVSAQLREEQNRR